MEAPVLSANADAFDGCQADRSLMHVPDPRRALLARFVLEHRLTARDPLAPANDDWEREATDIVLRPEPASPTRVATLLDS